MSVEGSPSTRLGFFKTLTSCMNISSTTLGTLLLTLITLGCTQEKKITSVDSTNKKHSVRSMSIQLPTGWKQLSPLPNDIHPFQNSQCDSTLAFCENLTIHFQPNDEKLSLQQIESAILEALSNRHKQYRLIHSGDTVIDSKPAKLIDYMFNERATDLGATMGVVIRNDTVVVVEGMALNQPKGEYAKYRHTMVSIIASLSSK